MTRSVYAQEIDPLLAANAAAELAGRRKLRAVAEAVDGGRTQREIAARLGVSQAAVHKMLVKARHTRDLGVVTPREVALRYAAGEITHAEMIETLMGFTYAPMRFLDTDNPLPEQSVPGDWGEVEAAALGGLLTDADVEAVIAGRAG